MPVTGIEEGRRRLAEKRLQEAEERQGAWIGSDPILGRILLRIFAFDPVIGDEHADPAVKRRAIDAAIAQCAVTASEFRLLDAAILRAKELFPPGECGTTARRT